MRPSIPREKNPRGYGTRSTTQLPSGCSASSESELVPFASGRFAPRPSVLKRSTKL